MNTLTHLTRISKNTKTGPIPVSTSSAETCPDSCPFREKGCYALNGPLALHWRKVTQRTSGLEWEDFCNQIAALPRNQLWRHNQAGDLCGINEYIDAGALSKLTRANRGRKVVICPATQREGVTCATCGLCQKQRGAIVGFPAHGNAKKFVSQLVKN